MSGRAHGVTPMQGSSFYPTRNFATLGMFVTPSLGWLPRTGSGHFCLTPHVAMRIGLSLHPSRTGAWRAVSEDPSRIVSMGLVRCLPATFMS
jgi:hypothetical protein